MMKNRDTILLMLFCFPGMPLAAFLGGWIGSLISGNPMFP